MPGGLETHTGRIRELSEVAELTLIAPGEGAVSIQGERRATRVPLTSPVDSPPERTQKWVHLLAPPHPCSPSEPTISFLARKPSVFARG